MTLRQLRCVAGVMSVTAGVLCCTGGNASRDASARSDTASARPRSVTDADSAHGAKRTAADSVVRVSLSDAAWRSARIVVEPARALAAEPASTQLEVPAQITFDPARLALVSPRTSGRIERLSAVVGDRVRGGQALAHLTSVDFLTAQSDYLQARRRAALLTGTPDAQGAEAIAAAARRRLALLGVPSSIVARLDEGGEPVALLPVVAPFNGTITQTMTFAGAAVQLGTPIFQIADVSTVEAIAQVPERVLAVVHEGQGASITVATFSSLRFSGRISRVLSELDSTTRTARVVIRLPNADYRLHPGMFATAILRVPAATAAGLGATGDLVTIPQRAVVNQGDKRYVFVQVAPRTYERREVDVVPFTPPGGATSSARLIVTHGLRADESVVVDGAFTLQSELAKSKFGESEG